VASVECSERTGARARRASRRPRFLSTGGCSRLVPRPAFPRDPGRSPDAVPILVASSKRERGSDCCSSSTAVASCEPPDARIHAKREATAMRDCVLRPPKREQGRPRSALAARDALPVLPRGRCARDRCGLPRRDRAGRSAPSPLGAGRSAGVHGDVDVGVFDARVPRWWTRPACAQARPGVQQRGRGRGGHRRRPACARRPPRQDQFAGRRS
jgi:hypothetical protein